MNVISRAYHAIADPIANSFVGRFFNRVVQWLTGSTPPPRITGSAHSSAGAGASIEDRNASASATSATGGGRKVIPSILRFDPKDTRPASELTNEQLMLRIANADSVKMDDAEEHWGSRHINADWGVLKQRLCNPETQWSREELEAFVYFLENFPRGLAEETEITTVELSYSRGRTDAFHKIRAELLSMISNRGTMGGLVFDLMSPADESTLDLAQKAYIAMFNEVLFPFHAYTPEPSVAIAPYVLCEQPRDPLPPEFQDNPIVAILYPVKGDDPEAVVAALPLPQQLLANARQYYGQLARNNDIGPERARAWFTPVVDAYNAAQFYEHPRV